jgi:hypothetical protein
MPQFVAAIVYTTESEDAGDTALDLICTAVEGIMDVGDVTQATLTSEDGVINDLLDDADEDTPADQDASSSQETSGAETQTGTAQDPNADPIQSLPTGNEF